MMEILKKLAIYDLNKQAQKLGIIESNDNIITKQDILELIKIINHLSLDIDDIKSRDFKKIIYVIGLITDYGLDRKYDLDISVFLSLTLTTIGMPIAAQMIKKDFINIEEGFLNIDGPSYYLNNLLNRNKITYNNKNYYLTDYQMQIYNQIDKNRILGINGDTSTGKSFSILLKLAYYLKHKRQISILYVVPTLSLENQVQTDFINMCGSEYVSTEYDKNKKKQILIQTYDKATFTVDEVDFDVVVVDEIQNMSEFLETDEHRKWKLYDLLKKIDIRNKYKRVILAGPYINNLTDFIKNTFKNSRNHRINVVDGKQIPVANIQYYFRKKDEKILFCTNTPFREIEEINIECPTQYNFPIEIFKYRDSNSDNVNNFLAYIYQKIYKDVNSTIMYIGARGRGEQVLEKINVNFIDTDLNFQQKEFVNFLEDTVHEKYFIIDSFKNKGVVVHNGILPRHVRNILELVFREGHIKGLITTSTLLQGVNMPIKNIIVKDLVYDGRSGREQRLDYYEHANLRGRAGRLMKDLVGRIFILGEEDICSYGNEETVNKELETNKVVDDDIIQQISEENILISNFENNLNDLNVRKRILNILATTSSFNRGMEIINKHFVIDNSEENIRNLKKMYNRVKSLEIRKKIDFDKFISQNIDWDLFELNKLYIKFKNGVYDELLKDFGINTPQALEPASKILRKLTAELLLNYPISSNRVLNKVFNKKDIDEEYTRTSITFKSELGFIYSLGIKYAREYSYKKMMLNFTNEDKINNSGNVLNIFKYYLIPLIKPIFQLYEKDNFIEASEIGGYSKGYKLLLEKTIERETAVRILDKFERKDRHKNIEKIEKEYVSKLKELNYWEKQYYKYILDKTN